MQYDSPITTENFQTFLSDASFSEDTANAISALLNLDAADTVNLASWDGVSAPLTPTGQTAPADVVTGTVPGEQGDSVVLNLPESLQSAKAIVLESQANLILNVEGPSAPAAVEAPAVQARVATLAVADEVTTTAATAEGIQFVVTTGSGDDVINVTGDQNSYIDAGAGNDTIVTGNGNNVVVAGVGNNNVTTGTGNDTIILTGTNHADVVNTGAGYDVVQLDGSASDYTVNVGNNFNVTLTGNQTAAISNAEFLTFNNEAGELDTIALAHSEAEAAALRLYQGLFGRDADAAGAKYWTSEVNNGTELTSIAETFLKASEFSEASNTEFVSDLYLSLLGREVGDDTTGLQGWLSALANGGSKADVVAGIATSLEAIQHDSSNGEFINSLYDAALGREAEQDGLDAWVGQLVNGASRVEVANTILGSAEASDKANNDFVHDLYVNALGRTEDEITADATGTAGWAQALANGASQADVAIAIVGSPEATAHIDNVVVLHGNV